ncbi:hypothetical protein [Arthrobacter sp. NA-172]|uniref:DUF7341 domain-containing protein n=1 Tax=Arthrobacter sp. NA-172 TaxID=3367524 RepID=UPI003754C730
MSLNDNVHQLCREHLKTGPDGKPHKVPALLDDLRAAVSPGNSGASGGKGGAPSPINIDAVDMVHRITKEAETEYGEMTGLLWNGTLDELLIGIGEKVPSAEWYAYLERISLEWINAITAFLWPTRPRRRLTGKVCPSCGLSLHGDDREVCLSLGCWDEAGELAHPGQWDIECGACGAAWSGDQVSWLLRALDTPNEVLTRSG